MSTFSQQIVQQIQTAKPRSKQWFLAVNIFYVFILVLAVFFGIASLTLFINNFWDLWQLQEQGFLTVESVFDFWVEFILVSCLLAGLAYFIYRQTEWPMVRQKHLLALVILVVVLAGAISLAWLIDHEPSLNTKRSIASGIIYRPKRADFIRERMNKKSVFVGRLENIEQDKIVVKNPVETRIFYFKSRPSLPRNQMEKPMVVVKFRLVDKVFVLESVEILPPNRAPINDFEFRPGP